MSERVIQIDLSSVVPAYRQVADGLRALLVAGAFTAGERLPPVRRLAMDLSIHHNTVAQAYRELAAEGWLDLTRGRGATVLDRADPPHPGENVEVAWQLRLAQLVAQGVAAGLPPAGLARALAAAAEQVRH
jgi:DNA-binding transcriptional regulator YhcF (GntR family)